MAKVTLHAPFRNVLGKLNKADNTIMRQKKYRADNGAVISYGALESYEVLNPRDYKKNPPKGAELQNINAFAEASRLTTLLIQAGKLTDEEIASMPVSEQEQVHALQQRLAHFKARFMAQLKRPDPMAPVLPKTDAHYNHNSTKIQRRQYKTLNAFVRTMIMQEIKAKDQAPARK